MAEQTRPDLERDRDPMDEDMIGREEEEFEDSDDFDEDEETDDF